MERPKLLKVFSSPTARVPHFHTLVQDNRRSWIGWAFDPSQGIYDKANKTFVGATVLKTVPEEIANTAEYRKLVTDGDLIAADKETARECRVTWQEPVTDPGNKLT